MTGVEEHVDHFRIITAFEPSPAGTAHVQGEVGWWHQFHSRITFRKTLFSPFLPWILIDWFIDWLIDCIIYVFISRSIYLLIYWKSECQSLMTRLPAWWFSVQIPARSRDITFLQKIQNGSESTPRPPPPPPPSFRLPRRGGNVALF